MGKEFTVEQLQALMKCVSEQKIDELLLETEGARLRIRGRQPAKPAAPTAAQPAPATKQQEEKPLSPPPAEKQDEAKLLTSPVVGTFYAAAGPDQEPFAVVGKALRKGETAFIVESMRVMNEVPAELDGVVAEILVESGTPVEYGQAILRLE